MVFLRCYPRLTDWFWAISNGAIDLRGLPVYSYGFMVACGFMAAAYVVTQELKRRENLGWMPALRIKDGKLEWTSELVGDMVIICAIFGILGANLFNYFENPSSYDGFWKDPVGSLFSGLSVYGGMICAGLVLLLFSWRKKIKIPHFFDSLAYCFILAVGIGRLGCQFAGDADWGVENTLAKPALIPQWLWADTYAHNIANEGVHIMGCIEQHCAELPVPVFPTPIYEFIECTLLFLLLHFIRKPLTHRPGVLFFVFAILIGIQRYSIEQLRAISDRNLYYIAGHGFKQAELISILLVIVGSIGVAGLFRYYNRFPAQLPEPLYISPVETPEQQPTI